MQLNKETILVFLMIAIVAVSIMQTVQALELSSAVASLKTISAGAVATAAPAGGGIVAMPISIKDAGNLGAVDIWLSYDKNVVTVESIANGDIGALAATNIDNANGVVKMNWFSAAGKTGDFVFAYITFKAIGAAGQTGLLNLTVKELVDANGNPIAHTAQDGKFAILPAAAGPAVSIVPPKTLVSPGGSFTIDIAVDPAGGSVSGGEIRLSFDAKALQVTSLAKGDMLGSDALDTGSKYNNTAGTVTAVLARIGTTPSTPTPPGYWAKVTFSVSNAVDGNYFINITFVGFSDKDFNDIIGAVSNVEIAEAPRITIADNITKVSTDDPCVTQCGITEPDWRNAPPEKQQCVMECRLEKANPPGPQIPSGGNVIDEDGTKTIMIAAGALAIMAIAAFAYFRGAGKKTEAA